MKNINLSKIRDKKIASNYIKEMCYKKVHKLYGQNLPKNIEERLNLELDSIIKNKFELKYLLSAYVVQTSKEMGYLTYTNGSVGNSFVAFLLEITNFNPIQYNLPFEMFASIKYDKQPDIALNISNEIENKILEDIKEFKDEIKIYGVDALTFLNKLQKATNTNPQDIDLEDTDTLNLISKGDTKGIFVFGKNRILDILKKLNAKDFYDLISISTLSHNSGISISDIDQIVKKLDISINDLPLNRADVMNYLIRKKIDKEKSYEITEFIRKGYAYKASYIFYNSDLKKEYEKKWKTYKKVLTEHNIPRYLIKIFENIKYLFPKAHCIAEIDFAFRIAWYKVHYPEAFYKVYFEMNKNIDINCYYMKAEVQRKLKRLYDERYGIEGKDNELEELINNFEILLEMFEKNIKKDEKRELDDYDIINSKAIGNYCREIKHKFNTEELAVLIYRNNKMSIEEKISKYQDLINNYPDMEVMERMNCKHYDSVKILIQEEINRLKTLYQNLIKEDENCVYTWKEYNRSTKSFSRTDDIINNLRKTYKEVYSEVKDYIEEYDDTISFSITKKFFNKDEIHAEYIVINKKSKLINIIKNTDNLSDLEGIFVNIPVPFKKGDILITNNYDENRIFVLEDLTIWNKRITDKYFSRNLDTSDMMGNGYYLLDDTAEIVLDHKYDYDSFEFYEGILDGTNRILKLVSSFLKGKIDNFELLIKAYETFKSSHETNMPDIYTEEKLKLAGFTDFDICKIKKLIY